ncbi:hypothetical protein P154DRAFT_615336 [Amniculicola lignicola CBS 123094]|uniref:Protein kinase domain-containing protein n=1 Tax=Amniculicola lignicola CBS 123094 TaxID=1392246 RepID=A0A6A5X0E1_9PLEO|nr:hypothetical protein P154DRAFT_615336 [Amniculicola lignicola CBS 123094]
MRQKADWTSDIKDTQTHLLAHAAYDGFSDFPPIHSSKISDAGSDCCLVVFSILLDLGIGHLVHHLAKKDIVDNRLPVNLSYLKKKLKPLEDGEKIAELFNKRQWKFLPAQFRYNMDKEFFEERIIPICRKDSLASGGTAHVWQIVVQKEFVGPKLRNHLAQDEFAVYDDEEFGPCYIFALKTFNEGYFQHYEDEKRAFDGLQDNKGVIRRLGCYSHRELERPTSPDGSVPKGKTTMNILLEYGTYDLRFVFGLRSPPVLPREIVTFWKSLFQVADAVSGIHLFKTGGNEFNGWHADIKPENIILVRNQYKLADPGFARFKKKTQEKGAAPPEIKVHGGTDTYGAPEVRRKDKVGQSIDIWSLGCVFSLAATWVVLGYQGVVQYTSVREKTLEALLSSIEDKQHPLLASRQPPPGSKLERLDCFHNGTDALPEIGSWHAYLLSSLRHCDPLTESIIELVSSCMLLEDPKKRIGSKDLCTELHRLVERADDIVTESVATGDKTVKQIQQIESLLHEIDRDATTQKPELRPEASLAFAPGRPVDRKALKAQLEQIPMKKTSNRFETLPPPKTPSHKLSVAVPTILRSDTSGAKETIHPAGPDLPGTLKSLQASHRTSTLTLGMSRSNTSTLALSHESENAIQAWEKLQREEKLRTVAFVPRRRRRKDKFLSEFFARRDIKFLVDDALSMSRHWDEATFLLETLVRKARGQDPDGMDLSFTISKDNVAKKDDPAAFRHAMSRATPGTPSRAKCSPRTSMKIPLGELLWDYYDRVVKSHDTVNKLTIIVLTDGLWSDKRDDLEVEIVDFHKRLRRKTKNPTNERRVSVQFIQFGDDAEARERLRRLDDDMPYRDVPDMIDCESFAIKGNIYKMLLGSFVEEMDAIKDDDMDDASTHSLSITPPSSPPVSGSSSGRLEASQPAQIKNQGSRRRLSGIFGSRG